MLKFSSAPDFEAPMGGADNDSNTYMVTVMAKAGGEMTWWKSPSPSPTWRRPER